MDVLPIRSHTKAAAVVALILVAGFITTDGAHATGFAERNSIPQVWNKIKFPVFLHEAAVAQILPFSNRQQRLRGELHRSRDLGVGFAFPRINLDGLVPPASSSPAPARREPAEAALPPAASLTVEKAHKLRTTQMEAACARIRASGAGAVAVPYADFLRLRCDAAVPDAGPSVARAHDESGSPFSPVWWGFQHLLYGTHRCNVHRMRRPSVACAALSG